MEERLRLLVEGRAAVHDDFPCVKGIIAVSPRKMGVFLLRAEADGGVADGADGFKEVIGLL